MADDRQSLSALDRMLVAGSYSLRARGYAGFLNQMHVWLAGRVDAQQLSAAIRRFGFRHPVVTARLVQPQWARSGYWRFRPKSEAGLQIIDLDTDDDNAVLRCAEDLLNNAALEDCADPMTFHLLRRPRSHDVLIVQYDHALTDTNGLLATLREIDRLADAADADIAPAAQHADEIRAHLRSFTLRQRAAAVLRTRVGPPPWVSARTVSLAPSRVPMHGPVHNRILLRTLGEADMAALKSRVLALCGYPSYSMALLAAAFRAIRSHSPQEVTPHDRLVSHIAFDLRPPNAGVRLRNLATVMPIGIALSEADDRDAVVNLLNHRLRARLKSRVDVGLLQLMSHHSRNTRFVRRQVRNLLFGRQSVNYGLFGGTRDDALSVCGTAIARHYHLVLSCAPPGLSLLGTRNGTRLILACTHVSECVPGPLAEAFLDTVVEELIG